LQARKSISRVAALWRTEGGKQDGSNADAAASAKVDAVNEGQLVAESAT